jgi:hypothetical protein
MDPRDVKVSIEATLHSPTHTFDVDTDSTTAAHHSAVILTPSWPAESRDSNNLLETNHGVRETEQIETVVTLRRALDSLRAQLEDRERLVGDTLAQLAAAKEQWRIERSARLAERDAVISMQHDLIVEKNREIHVLSEVNSKLRCLLDEAAKDAAAAKLALSAGQLMANQKLGKSPQRLLDSASPPSAGRSCMGDPSASTAPLWIALGSLFTRNRPAAQQQESPIRSPSPSPEAQEHSVLRPLMSKRRVDSLVAVGAVDLKSPLPSFSPVSIRLPAIVSAPSHSINASDVHAAFGSTPQPVQQCTPETGDVTSADCKNGLLSKSDAPTKTQQDLVGKIDPQEKHRIVQSAAQLLSERQAMRIARLRSDLDKIAHMRNALESMISPIKKM